MEGKFIPDEYKEGIKTLGDSYDITQHGRPSREERQRTRGLAEELGVADYLRERSGGLTGTPEWCEENIKRLAGLGVNQFTTSLPGPDRPGRLRRWHDLVMTRVM